MSVWLVIVKMCEYERLISVLLVKKNTYFSLCISDKPSQIYFSLKCAFCDEFLLASSFFLQLFNIITGIVCAESVIGIYFAIENNEQFIFLVEPITYRIEFFSIYALLNW